MTSIKAYKIRTVVDLALFNRSIFSVSSSEYLRILQMTLARVYNAKKHLQQILHTWLYLKKNHKYIDSIVKPKVKELITYADFTDKVLAMVLRLQ